VTFIKTFAELGLNRVMMFSILIGVGWFFSYFDTGKTLEGNIANMQALVQREQDRKTEISKTMKKEEEMRGNLLQLRRNLDVVRGKIPSELKDSEMQAIINNAAKESGVNITGLKANSGPPKDPNAPIVQISIQNVRPENLIDEVRFQISLVGTFDDLLKFLETLTLEDKVIKVKNFNIYKNSDSIDDNRIRFDGDIVGFKQAKIEIVSGVK
jgi:Tfp pilus assembly protein PilO